MKTKQGRTWIALAAAATVALALAWPRAATRADEGNAGLKIGYVDLSRVFKKYPLTRTLAKELREWKIAQEEEMEKKKTELLALRDRLVSLSSEERREAHGSMIAMNRELTERGNTLQAEIRTKVLENDRKVYENVCAAIDRVAARDGFDLVLQIRDRDIAADDIEVQTLNIKSRVLLHASDRLDLTDLVLEALETLDEGKEEEK